MAAVRITCVKTNCGQDLGELGNLASRDVLTCVSCGTSYPLIGGIPVLRDDVTDYLEAAQIALEGQAYSLARCPDDWAQVLLLRTQGHLNRIVYSLDRIEEADGSPGQQETGQEPRLTAWTQVYVSEMEFNERLRWAYGPYVNPLHEGTAEGLYATLFRLAFNYTRDMEEPKMLEVGAGEGRNVLELSRLGGTVVGLDASITQSYNSRELLCGDSAWQFFFRAPTKPEYLVAERYRDTYYAEAHIPPFGLSNATFLTADARLLPFADESFDLVVFTNALNFTGAPREAIAQVRRVLRPGGVLIIGDMFTYGIQHKLDFSEPEYAMNNKYDLLQYLQELAMQTEQDFTVAYMCHIAEGRDEIWQEHFVVSRKEAAE